MKKFSILMSVLVILSMFLVACGAADDAEETLSPTTGAMETVEPIPGTGATAAATTAAPQATATEQATEEATQAATSTAAATGLPGTGSQGTGNAVLLSVLMDADVRMVGNAGASGTRDQAGTPAATQAITGTATTDAGTGNTGNADGQSFGTVEDLVVNLCTQEIHWVLVDADDDVAGERTNHLMIPYEALQWVRGNNPADADIDKGYFMLNGSVNASVIQGAPDVDVLLLDFNMTDWDVDLNAYWSTEIQGMDNNQSANCTFSATGMSGSTGGTPAATEEQGMETTATVGMTGISEDGIVLASNLLGMNVMDTAGEDVGEVNDAVVLINGGGSASTGSTGSAKSTPQATKSSSGAASTDSKMMGDLHYIVIGAGGILGIGEKNIPVPASALSYDETSNSLIVNMDSEAFSTSPTIELDDLDIVNWSVDIDAYWASSYNR
jgi:sporulation protein YlmC with PRC-barrel domain